MSYFQRPLSLVRLPAGVGDVDKVPPAQVLRDEQKALAAYVVQCDADLAEVDAAEAAVVAECAENRAAIHARRAEAVARMDDLDNAAKVLELGVRWVSFEGPTDG